MRLNDWVTAERAYVRLQGRGRCYDYLYTDAELIEIAGHIKSMLSRGAKTIYIYFNNDHHGYAVKNAADLNKILAER
ncbi:MAG: hypothetical protein A2176_10310 [Spirochaetes bacterium RBG_13_51_14]|nr:MAG: hypothetical protein A2176_10310 [Spirochaetes bacterium RBG_13_51_14]